MSTVTAIQSCANSIYTYAKNNKSKSIAFCVASSLLFRYCYVKIYRKLRHLPPGPIGLPFIGCLLNAGNFQTFCNYVTMTYGPIAYFEMGSTRVLLIGHSTLSKQFFEDKRFQDRPLFSAAGRKDEFESFLQMKYNNECIKRRKYAQSIFVASCTSTHIDKILTNTMDSDIISNIEKCCSLNKNWSPVLDLKYLTWNIVFHLNFGRSILRTDALYSQLEQIENEKKDFSLFKLLAFRAVPFLAQIYPSFFENISKTLEKETDFYANIFAKRKKEINIDSNQFEPQTYCDYLLSAQHRNEMTLEQCVADTLLMYIAGSETTANTIFWGLILTAKHAQIQEKVRNELKKVYGQYINDDNMKFDLSKLNKLPMFRAFIFEILRISSVLPRSVPRKVWDKNGVEFEYKNVKYSIPSGTQMFNNTQYIHTGDGNCNENWQKHNQTINLDNWLFYDVERNKYKIKNNSSFTAFGFGRRECIGRVVAMEVIQLFFGKLLLKYSFELDDIDKNQKLISSQRLVSFLTNNINIKVTYCK